MELGWNVHNFLPGAGTDFSTPLVDDTDLVWRSSSLVSAMPSEPD